MLGPLGGYFCARSIPQPINWIGLLYTCIAVCPLDWLTEFACVCLFHCVLSWFSLAPPSVAWMFFCFVFTILVIKMFNTYKKNILLIAVSSIWSLPQIPPAILKISMKLVVQNSALQVKVGVHPPVVHLSLVKAGFWTFRLIEHHSCYELIYF